MQSFFVFDGGGTIASGTIDVGLFFWNGVSVTNFPFLTPPGNTGLLFCFFQEHMLEKLNSR